MVDQHEPQEIEAHRQKSRRGQTLPHDTRFFPFLFCAARAKGTHLITDDPARRLLTAQHDERGVQDAGISGAELIQITKKKPARERLFLGSRFSAQYR